LIIIFPLLFPILLTDEQYQKIEKKYLTNEKNCDRIKVPKTIPNTDLAISPCVIHFVHYTSIPGKTTMGSQWAIIGDLRYRLIPRLIIKVYLI